ncbi:MAG: helix-turn-helix transcriptional regulator [Proteobacteria bacterium]|nr:helix-turn-helix transcriptional regulator [Pseudomonadota bacterium]
MSRTNFDKIHCPIARTAAVLSDPWTALVLREAMSGTTRFTDFERALGIPKNTLTERLEHLVEHDILERKALPPRGRRFEYLLTPKGTDLLTVMSAMRDWSNRWVFGKGKEPVVVVDQRTGRRVPPVRIRDDDGELIPASELMMKAGPGADAETKARIKQGRIRRA